jgi:hypothetical protein
VGFGERLLYIFKDRSIDFLILIGLWNCLKSRGDSLGVDDV